MLFLFMSIFSFFFLVYDFFLFFFFLFFFFFSLLMFNFGFFDGFFFSDFLSLVLMFVSLWVFLLSMMSMSFSLFSVFLFWFMFFFTLFSFFSVSFFFFYLSFELVFVVLFFYLLSMGKSFERIQASFYMFFYTLFFSFPFLIFIIEHMAHSSDFFLFFGYFSYTFFFWIFMFIVFMVKIPIFSFHSWLIKAHVEAPVAGSMVLAGVMLKLGGYGIIRFLPLLKDMSFLNFFFIPFLFYLGILGSVFVSILCFRQMDLKMLIAYSSVVHMGLMFLGILSFIFSGVLGSMLMMVCHGFISPLMFFLMNKPYSSFSSRSILLLKSVFLINPVFCLLWFFSCMLNLGLPPFMSFFSEILIMGSMSFVTAVEFFFFFFFFLFTGVYCIYSYVSLSHGYFVYFSLLYFSFMDFLISFLLIYFILIYPFIFFS